LRLVFVFAVLRATMAFTTSVHCFNLS
jgi:hypothetical protein